MNIESSFDYIIVGAGSAGCVLAHRLSEAGDASVLLIEAGGSDRNPLIRVPLGLGKLHQHRLHDWGLNSDLEPSLGDRSIPALRGKVLGGSHSINVMGFTREVHADYDAWSRGGAPGWSFAEVLPYFRRSENWELGEDAWRGGSGPVHVQFGRGADALNDGWRQAAAEAGYPWSDDVNGAVPEGFCRMQYTIRNGRRHSTAAAYLRPALRRHTLTLVKRAHVTRVTVRRGRATGVQYVRGGKTVEVHAAREVILCAGAYHTPKLLMLSGIGPADFLQQFCIDTLVDLPVGQNLQDHLAAWFSWERNEPGPFHRLMRFDRIAVAMLRAYLLGTGPGSYLPSSIFGFVRTQPGLAAPDIELMFRGTSSSPHIWFPGVRPAYRDEFSIRPTLLHPRSRGRVLLRSADPFDKVRIQNNFLDHPDDLATLVRGSRMALDLASSPALARFRGANTYPKRATTDAEIVQWIRQAGATANHPCGTCAIGPVLDSELRVHGIDGLRVADAAAMPTIVSGHINAAVMMIAEKASDMIRGLSTVEAGQLVGSYG